MIRRVNWVARANELAEFLGWCLCIGAGMLMCLAVANIGVGIYQGESWALVDAIVLGTVFFGGSFYVWLTTDDFGGDA